MPNMLFCYLYKLICRLDFLLFLNKYLLSWQIKDVQAGFRKHRGTRDQIASIHWIVEKEREFQKNIYFCFIDSAKAFDCVDHNKLENSERDRNTRPPYLPPEKLYAGQEATVRTEHRVANYFKIGKGLSQGCILLPCLFNVCAEYIMQNARLDEEQAGILPAEISITSEMQMTPLLWQKLKWN